LEIRIWEFQIRNPNFEKTFPCFSPNCGQIKGMEVRSVEAVIRALNEAKVRYLIVGGVSVNAHGYERMTIDLDLVIQLNRPNIEAAWGALVNIGYIVKIPISAAEFSNVTLREAWQREKGMLVLQFWSDIHRRTPIDIFVR
jgi:hypothetical protein